MFRASSIHSTLRHQENPSHSTSTVLQLVVPDKQTLDTRSCTADTHFLVKCPIVITSHLRGKDKLWMYSRSESNYNVTGTAHQGFICAWVFPARLATAQSAGIEYLPSVRHTELGARGRERWKKCRLFICRNVREGSPVAGWMPGRNASGSVLTRTVKSGPEVWRRAGDAEADLNAGTPIQPGNSLTFKVINHKTNSSKLPKTSIVASIIRTVGFLSSFTEPVHLS